MALRDAAPTPRPRCGLPRGSIARVPTASELLLGAALRIGEACALEWHGVDTDALTIRVSRSRKLGGTVGGTKGDRSRIVHISPRLAAVLEAHRLARDPRTVLPLVFVTQRGTMLNPANVRNRPV